MILISVALILATFAPFIILNNSGKGEAKAISKKIKEIATREGLKFHLKESWGNSFIAIDRMQKVVLFAKATDRDVDIKRIDLIQVDKCTIHKKSKLERSHTGNTNVLQKLDLEITFLAHHKEACLLNFYDVDHAISEDYEMQRAEKWETVINEAVKTAVQEKKVA